MSESYIYIDAPSLDNTDQSKFVFNSDFNFVQAGDASKGAVAEFPIYGKFTNTEWRNSITDNSLPRTNFKPGKWQLTQNTNINLGGDYVAGNTAQVHISNFIVGKLTKLRFRFYDKTQITDANRVEGFVHNEISDYSEVPLVYVLAVVYKADGTLDSDNFKVVALARRENGASATDNVYTLDRDFRISPKNLTTNDFRLTFVFAPANSNIQLNENTIYNFINLRANANANIKKVGIRSVPRGPLDNKSYICQDGGTQFGIENGQNRLLDFDYLIENDLIEEYLGGASTRHHISTLDIESLNLMKYSAPQINVTSYTRKNTAAQKVFISDNSLSRNGVLKIKGEKITAVQIPFTSSYVLTDYETSSLINNRFDKGGIWHTNRYIWVWQGDGAPPTLSTSDATNTANGWVKSNELIAFSYFDVPIVYSVTFGTDGLPYEGKGIWISANKPEHEGSGRNNLAVHYYEKDGTKYAYNSNDKIYSDATEPASELVATGDVRVVFNYKLRNDWFNYLESLLLSNNV